MRTSRRAFLAGVPAAAFPARGAESGFPATAPRAGIAIETPEGGGELWGRVSGAGSRLEGVWRPVSGPEERLVIA